MHDLGRCRRVWRANLRVAVPPNAREAFLVRNQGQQLARKSVQPSCQQLPLTPPWRLRESVICQLPMRHCLASLSDRDPFKSVNATEERRFLPEYFVAPPFFESVWGNSHFAKSCVVFAPTGAGKTAQVIMLQERASSEEKSSVLTLLYDDFERQGILSIEGATIEKHLHAINRIAVVAILKAIGNSEASLFGSVGLSATEREEVAYLAGRYLGGASEEALVASLRSIRSPAQKLSDAVGSVATAIPVVAAGLKLLSIEPVSTTLVVRI